MLIIKNSKVIGASKGDIQFSKIYKGVDLYWKKHKIVTAHYDVTFTVNGDYYYKVYVNDSTSYTKIETTTTISYKEGTKIVYTIECNKTYLKTDPNAGTIASLVSDMIIEPSIEYNLMEILAYDYVSEEVKITKPEQLLGDPVNYYPVGIIVIPKSHDIYGTGECGVMALRYASYTDPDNGTANRQVMALPYFEDSKLSGFNTINAYRDRTDFTLKAATNAYLPILTENSADYLLTCTECPTDPGHYYMDAVQQSDSKGDISLSPYSLNEERNEDYYTTSLSKYNCLSDLDGKSNTESWISEHSSGQTNWETAETLENVHQAGYSTSPWACKRYGTIGIEKGNWYLPSCGELAYVPVRMEKVVNTIDFIKTLYPSNGYLELEWNRPTQTSTKYRYDQQRVVYLYGGKSCEQTVASYTSNAAVIPFTRGNWKKSIPDTPTKPTVYQLDQSISDPTKMVTGEFGKDGDPETNVVSWIRANSHRYVGNYNSESGMILRQLDDDNSEKYADGTSALNDIKGNNGGDVFMKMPDFWFRGEMLAPNNYNIYFSATKPKDNNAWVKWDGNTLIGVYEAVCEDANNNTNGGLFSRSGVTPRINVSQANFKAKARNRSNGNDHFMIETYEAHQAMALLYMCYYGNMNSQSVVGAGTSSYPKLAGGTNVDGMKDTVNERNRSINFWGIENWWGDIYCYVDNLITLGSSKIQVLDYDGNPVREISGYSSAAEISKMVLGETLDVFPQTTTSDSSYSRYYCSYGYIFNGPNKICKRSYYTNYAAGGIFFLGDYGDATGSQTTEGARLLYNGRVTIDNSSKSTLKRVKAVNTWKPIDLQYVYYNNRECLRTGMDFHICNLEDFSKLENIKLSGLNINYEDIKFNTRDYEGIEIEVDYEGNITLIGNDTYDTISIDLEYEDNIIGTINLHRITEEEVIEEDRRKHEAEMENK